MDDETTHPVFAGLSPERLPAVASGPPKTMNPTVPILVVGTMAVLNLTPSAAQPAEASSLAPSTEPGTTSTVAERTPVSTVRALARASKSSAPRTYRVARGDSVASIAARFGLSATSILALNGLSRSSLIFPGQVLALAPGAKPSKSAAASQPSSHKYTVVAGDTVATIAHRFGVQTSAVLTANGLRSSSVIRPGQVLRIPDAVAPAALEAVPVSAVTPVAGATYLVRSGDTISSIAAALRVSVAALLDANGLSPSSTIYAGTRLHVPAGAPAPAAGVTALGDEQAANARTIIAVGRELGVPDYGIVIALATAMQESSMRNLSYGHLDSVGLFQQRPSAGWGTVTELTDQAHAARLFYGGPRNPNKGKTHGLLDISGWQSLTLTQAAQKVQVSAYPDAYAKWESSARSWLSQLR